MALDPVKNFAEVEVSTGYDAAATSIVLSSGEGTKLPDPSSDGEFNLVWFNYTDYPNPADDPNVEIVRVTAKATDTLTVTRAQESTSATTKNTADKTYYMVLSITKKMIDDIGAPIVVGHTWAVSGEIKVASGATDHLLPMPIELPAGQTANLTMCKWGIYSGTNCNVKLQKGSGFEGGKADITGFTNITVTTTGGSTDPTDVALADNDYIWLIVNSVSATPTHLHFTIYIEYTV